MGFCAPDKRHTRGGIPRYSTEILSQITQFRTADRAFSAKRVMGFGVNRVGEFLGITPVVVCSVDGESRNSPAQVFKAELPFCDSALAFPDKSCYDVGDNNGAEEARANETEPSRHYAHPETASLNFTHRQDKANQKASHFLRDAEMEGDMSLLLPYIKANT